MSLRKRGFQIGLAAVVGLVLLRITIGWHFLYQGIWKLQTPDFSSEAFLANAKGPLAPWFYGLVPDIDGRQRLDLPHAMNRYNALGQAWISHYRMTAQQTQRAEALVAARKSQVEDFFRGNEEALATYFHDLDRLEAERQAAGGRHLPYERQRHWDRQQQLRSQGRGWLNELESMRHALEADLAELLTPEQRALGPPRDPAGAAPVDRLVTLSNVAIGLCLMVGLLTRFAALSGALFLLMIVLAQPDWPTVYPPAPPMAGQSLIVNKEFVEMMALVALGLSPVGRWGGLDYIIHHAVVRRFLGRRSEA